jgi:hypothetical protein
MYLLLLHAEKKEQEKGSLSVQPLWAPLRFSLLL